MWTEKYKPEKLDDFVGGKTTVEAIRKFDWKKPLLVYGASGVGKTALINAIASEMNFDIVEIEGNNIDDALSIAETSSLYGGRRLIVIDDVEGVSDMKKIAALLEATKSPTILATGDAKSKKIKEIKKMCFELQLRRPQAATIANHLKGICDKEGVKAEKEVLQAIAEKSRGDIRIAITDLETIAKGKTHVTEKDLEAVYERDVGGDIYKTLSVIFGGKKLEEVISSTWDLDEEPRNVIFWIEENTPSIIQEAKPLSNAFHYLSRADLFLGRVMRRQYWGFLRYANALMTAGVNTSREKVRYAMYKFPSYFAKLGRSKGDRNMAKSIGEKLKRKIHSSNKAIARDEIPLLKVLLKNNKVDEETLKAEYMLSEEELTYIKES